MQGIRHPDLGDGRVTTAIQGSRRAREGIRWLGW
jgi:hypothetical protein